MEQALALIGSSDGVAADYFLVPHLTHRNVVYTFPNPWVNKNYGISPESRGDTAAVHWMAADKALMGEEELTLFLGLIDSGEFGVRLEAGSFVVAERLRAPK